MSGLGIGYWHTSDTQLAAIRKYAGKAAAKSDTVRAKFGEGNAKKPLPPRQQQTLEFIRAALAAGRSPSIYEIRDHLGVSSLCSAHKHVVALKAKGLIEWRAGRKRTLALVTK